MNHASLDLQYKDGLATITLGRPEVLNCLNEPMLQELLEVTGQVRHDQTVKAVLLTASGRGFCAGADLAEAVAAGGTRDARGEQAQRIMQQYYNPIALNLAMMPKPVVCAVNGIAAGGGVGLALSCDVVFAAASASFVQVFVPRLGIIPDVGSTWYLPRLLGNARAMGLVLSGEALSAKKAEEWGLIWRCCEDDSLLSEAVGFAENLAQGPALAISWAKKALRLSESKRLDEQLAFEADAQRICCATLDAEEGFQAFVEKRSPRFNGC